MQAPDLSQAVATAAKVHNIGAAARRCFIERDEAVTVLEVAITSGEHLLLLGAPGTAKSALVRYFAAAMGLRFYRRVLNPDTVREDLVGPINPHALAQGRWERAWAGLATADFALLDEIGKASNQVQNMFLDAMEERRVTSGDVDMDIPLHLAVAGSNETLGPEQEAVFDRFTLRLVVHGITDPNSFARLLTDSWAEPVLEPISRDELTNLRNAVRAMAAHPDATVIEKLTLLWTQHGTKSGERISDRRWKRVLLPAAGNALLRGATKIEVEDLIVAKHMLWASLDEIPVIQNWIDSVVNEELAALRTTRDLLAELRRDLTSDAELATKAQVSYKAGKLLKDIRSRSGSAWDALRREITDFRDAI